MLKTTLFTAAMMVSITSYAADVLGTIKPTESALPANQTPSKDSIDVSNQSLPFKSSSKSIMVMSKQEIADFRAILKEYSKALLYREIKKYERKEDLDRATHISSVPGYSTIVNFVDSSGEPWEIDYILSSNDNIIKAGKLDMHTILIVSSKIAGEINLIVKLKGEKFTHTFYVNASDDTLDATRTFKLHARNPTYKPISMQHISNIPSIKTDSVIMEQFLSNTPPSKAESKQVDRERIAVWTFNGKMYIRTKFILASPMAMANQGTARNRDGYYVYRLSSPTSRLNMLVDGEYFLVKVSL